MSEWRLDLLEIAGKMEVEAAEVEDQGATFSSPTAGS